MAEPLVVIKMKLSNGSTGYHSVWRDGQRALAYQKRLSSAHKEVEYTVYTAIPAAESRTWNRKRQVRFADSTGWLEVN